MSLIPFSYWGGLAFPTIVTTDLILHWDAGNPSSYSGSGTFIQDLTTSNYGGTLNGPIYNSADGGKFVLVKSEVDWINSIGTTSGSAVVGTSDFSIEIWCRPTNINQQGYLLSNRSSSSGDRFSLHLGTVTFGAGFTDSKKISLVVYQNSSSYGRELLVTDDVIDGSWKHIVVTRVGSTFTFYVNSVSKAFTTVRSLASGTPNLITGTTWRIADGGGGTGGSGASINSDVSIVRLYNNDLTSTEVLQNFNAEKSRYEGGIPLAGLKMYFNFAGGGFSGTTVTDFTGITNGTLTGGAYNSGNGGYMTLNGTSDFINTNRTSNGSDIGIFYGSWSIVYCVRFPNITGIKNVFGSSNAPGVNVQSGATNATITYVQNGNTSTYSSISASTWYHVVVSYDYAAYTPKIYINGVLQVTGFAERMTGADWLVYLGRTNTTYYAFDLGLAMIYNKIVTGEEVSNIYNNQKSRFGLT